MYLACQQGVMDLKNILCQIDPNHYTFQIAVLSIVWLSTPQSWHKSMPSGEGATTPS
tara:strand:- start:5223 stop:5393 length:171 start_codon:yes stop_codon:yes gene_type:complete